MPALASLTGHAEEQHGSIDHCSKTNCGSSLLSVIYVHMIAGAGRGCQAMRPRIIHVCTHTYTVTK